MVAPIRPRPLSERNINPDIGKVDPNAKKMQELGKLTQLQSRTKEFSAKLGSPELSQTHLYFQPTLPM